MSTITPQNYLFAAFSGQSLNATHSGEVQSDSVRSLSGKLKYPDDKRAAEDIKVKFFVSDFFNIPHYIGTATSDNQGRFQLDYTLKKFWFGHNKRVTLGIVEDRLPFANHGIFLKKEVTLQKIDIDIDPNEKQNDLGTLFLNYADISKDITALQVPTASHMQPPSYFWKLFKALLPEVPKVLFISLFKNYLTIEQVQRIYDSFGPSYPKRPSTPSNLIDELLNHITAVDPVVTADTVVWTANWDGLDFDKEKSLPNVTVTASRDTSGVLNLESIAIKFREDANETIVKPEDKSIDWAIYLARSAFTLKGEAEHHLAEGHILPGIAAKVFFKHIKPDNPLFAPLEPHLSQLEFINWFGSRGLIFGTGSVLDASALNDKSVTEVIIKAINKKANWLKYSPPKTLAPNHCRANCERLHFNLLWVFFHDYIHKHKDEIIKHWSSIYSWSEGIRNLIQTFPAITTTESKPTELDLVRLSKCIAWLATKTTFLHWSAHSRQQLLTDIRQVSLAIEERGLTKDGTLDPFGNTLPENGSKQLQIARVLMNFKGDSIFKNPNGDMDKDLLASLRKLILAYEGYKNIIDMHLATQI